jgi:nucleolar protein 56
MKILYLTPLGIIIGEKDRIIDKLLFSKDLSESAEIYKAILEGVIDEKILSKIRGFGEVLTPSSILFDLLDRNGINVKLIERSFQLSEIIVEAGMAKDINEAIEKIRIVMDNLTRLKLQEDLANKDLMIIHSLSAYEEYTEAINIMYERLREWYGTYFPELSDIVKKIESYVNLVSKFTSKENYTEEALKELGYSDQKIRRILDASRRSVGGYLRNEDLEMIKEYADAIKKVIETRDRIDIYIRSLMEDVAPNVTAIVGYKLGAKLITKAGGLSRLAMLPASTIQLLGAEKALFRALGKGAKPPKHGYIFQHPYINQSPRPIRGKIARMMASKIAIAARADAFGGEFIGDKLSEELRSKVDELRKTFKKKPKPKKRRRR